jgi:SAM-dependent methyltransferase
MSEAVNYNRFLTALVLRCAERGGLAVDFGAGSGTLSRPLSSAGLSIAAIEPDPQLARRRDEDGIRTHASASEPADGAVGFVFSFNVLEHIADDAQAVAELYRILKPGGRLLLYVPALDLLFSSMDRKVGHLRRCRRESLAALASDQGFRVIRNEYVDSLGFPAPLLYKLLDRGTGDLRPGSVSAYDRLVFPLSRLTDRAFGKLFGKNVLLVAVKD